MINLHYGIEYPPPYGMDGMVAPTGLHTACGNVGLVARVKRDVGCPLCLDALARKVGGGEVVVERIDD